MKHQNNVHCYNNYILYKIRKLKNLNKFLMSGIK